MPRLLDHSRLHLLYLALLLGAGCGDGDAEQVGPPACPQAPDSSGGPLYQVSTFADVGGKNEGLAFDGKGTLYVSLTEAGKVVRVDAAGQVTDFASGLSRPAGIALAPGGDLWVCEYGTTTGGGKLSKVTPGGQVSVVTTAAGARPLVNPNHLAITSTGTVYMSDSSGFVARVQGSQASVFFDAAKTSGGTASPNGMALSADQRTLYVNDLYAAKGIWRLALDAQGALLKAEALPLNSPLSLADGIALDCRGHLYVTYALTRVATVDPKGWKVTDLAAGAGLSTPANVAFGSGPGFDPRALYIAQLALTSMDKTVLKLHAGLPGMALPGTR